MTYIDPEIKDRIIEVSNTDMEAVIRKFTKLVPSGANKVGECHNCNKAKGLSFSPSKSIVKCFSCDTSATSSVAYLTNFEKMSFPEALHLLADMFEILVEEKKPKGKKQSKRTAKMSFCDQKLKSSGIKIKDITYKERVSKTKEIEKRRYEKGGFNQYGVLDYSIDDMLLNYLGLDGKPIYFIPKKSTKQKPLVRVRHQFPQHHLNRAGDEIKYASPGGSGSHLWYPNRTIYNVKAQIPFDTLIVTEGELKADALALLGFLVVGVMGIHNFAYSNEMPEAFYKILKSCGVKNVIFLLDTDWQDISIKNTKAVEHRPRTFFSAVKKFRKYFYGFAPEIELNIYFGHHLSKKSKGIDDFIVDELKKDKEKLFPDFQKALTDRTGKSEYLQLYNITTISEYKLQEFWHLDSSESFFDAYKEQLIKLKTFKAFKLKRKVNDDGEIEIDQKILDHEKYWIEEYTGKNKSQLKISFDPLQIYNFLRNRNFGRYYQGRPTEKTASNYSLIYIEDRIVYEIDPLYIQLYIKQYTLELDNPHKKDIARMLLRNLSYYLGQDKLSRMDELHPKFYEPQRFSQYVFFEKWACKIDDKKIKLESLNNSQYNIWAKNIVQFEPKIINNYFEIKRAGDDWIINDFEKPNTKSHWERSEIVQFLWKTSMTYWKKYQHLITKKDGTKEWINKDPKDIVQPTLEELKDTKAHFVSKLIALGSTFYDYWNAAERKAIIAMDMEESEVGKSQGGSGKSFFCEIPGKLNPQFIIDGKNKKTLEDAHVYEGVTESTKTIFFDDCRVNFDFESLFNIITRRELSVNPKGLKKFTVPSPHILLATNHAINANVASEIRRQYIVAFSDYYNVHRTIGDDFGHQLFEEWDQIQWNYFYNLIFISIQLFLQHGFKYKAPMQNIEKRRLRQKIGENFLEWATMQFGYSSEWLNQHVEKKYACDTYLRDYPNDAKWMDVRKFKSKCKDFAKYAGLDFNPSKQGEAIKSGNLEYICLANKEYRKQDAEKIERDGYKPY